MLLPLMHSSGISRRKFLGRLDGVLWFQKLSEESRPRSQNACYRNCSSGSHMEIAMEYTLDAVRLLANAPKIRQYGARPMKQHLATMVENPIADKMLHNALQAGDEICLTAKEQQFVVLDKCCRHKNTGYCIRSIRYPVFFIVLRAIPHKDCATDASSNFSSDETKAE